MTGRRPSRTPPTGGRAVAAEPGADLLVADAVGEVIEYWGFKRILGRLWAILYLEDQPLTAAELQQRLGVSAGTLSMGLAELGRWGVVHRMFRPGERAEYFRPETDLWAMVSRVLGERERRLVISVQRQLEDAAERIAQEPAGPDRASRAERVQKLSVLADVAGGLLDAFLATRRVDATPLTRVIALGERLRRAAFGGPASRDR